MRVISGKSRGAKLIAPEGNHTRPTIDRIKETLFNMISFDLPGCMFLDLFSGSGGIGIESLSRGATEVIFVDDNAEAIKCIKQNLEKTKLHNQAIVYNMNVGTALKKMGTEGKQFDIVFLDPPYHLEGIDTILNTIVELDLLKRNGYIILERSSDVPVELGQGLRLIKEKQYKTTTLSFFERTENK